MFAYVYLANATEELLKEILNTFCENTYDLMIRTYFVIFKKKKCWYQQKRVILAKQNVQSRFSFWNSIIVSTSLQRFKSLVVFVLKLKLDKKCTQNTVKHPRWLSKHSTGIPENKDSGFWRTHTGPRTFEDPGSLRIQELEDPGP